jgi:glycosyltransferase involved in cell wall biosynthesis
VRARTDWVTLHEHLSRAALRALAAGQRYGIHGMAEEHVGIAVAEMVRAGCIPFVPDGGGQREIVGGDPRLLYPDAADGAERLVRVMDDAALQAELRAALAARAPLLTPAHLMRRFREVVAEIIEPRAA